MTSSGSTTVETPAAVMIRVSAAAVGGENLNAHLIGCMRGHLFRGGRLDQRRDRLDVDRFLDGADFNLECLTGRLPGTERQAAPRRRFETGQLNSQRVGAGRQRRQREL